MRPAVPTRWAVATSKVSSRAKSYSNKRDILLRFGERFADIVIENLDWSEMFEKSDIEGAVIYLDPPYVGKEDYYPIDTIDHGALVDGLGELDGHWICSYSDLPDGLDKYHVVGRDENHFMGNGGIGSAKSA